VNASVYKLNFDPVADITPIIQVSQGPLVIVVNPKVPAKDLKELIALAKAKPDEVNFASFGPAASSMPPPRCSTCAPHQDDPRPLQGERPGTHRHPRRPDPGVLQQRVDSGFTRTCRKAARGGRDDLEAHPALPDVPTVAEQGVADYDVTLWHG
jgi:hypothetical protein